MTKPNDNPLSADSSYQVYLLRLRQDQPSNRWYITLQPAQESRQRVFADLPSLMLYLEKQMSGRKR